MELTISYDGNWEKEIVENSNEILSKMTSLAQNIDKLEELDEFLFESIPSYRFTHIECDMNNQIDEFFITAEDTYMKGQVGQVIQVEVVTKDVAELNDKAFENDDDEDNYVVGESCSNYRPLDDKYYFRLM